MSELPDASEGSSGLPALTMADLAPVYAKSGARLLAVATAALKGSGLSPQDAVAQVFTSLSVQAQAGELRQPASGWEPYLVTAVRNASVSLLRKQRPEESLDDTLPVHAAAVRRAADPDPTGDLAVSNVDLARRTRELRAALSSLSDRDRLILNRKHWHDAKNSEIGKALGLSGQRVGQLYARALEKLREELTSPNER